MVTAFGYFNKKFCESIDANQMIEESAIDDDSMQLEDLRPPTVPRAESQVRSREGISCFFYQCNVTTKML
jgi:hypothetical protein